MNSFAMRKLIRTAVFCCAGMLPLTGCGVAHAQDKLSSNSFPLADVVLLDGPFKHARDLNHKVLLEYDVDRLMQPFRKEAGLPEKGVRYPNWAGLDGHVGGHYLSALALHYAATNNADCKKRLDYMLAEIKSCQDANAINHPDWGIGYAGGVPNSRQVWSTFQKGDLTAFRASWVAWYNVHKMYAGLKDAWLYAGSNEAKDMFLKFCDWAINITSAFTHEQMQTMLDIEHGGMNEIFADAYQMTGDQKYVTAAKRFSHRMLFDAMATGNDNLDNKHANTQVPKAIGFQRIGEVSNDEAYRKAGSFFWETVTTNRSLAFGGNSRREFFPSVAASSDFVNEVEGPETCNSYNMLKLTEDLFRINPLVKYADYYERTLYNHILSTQHPAHGGYVYFTPARPRHYRVYSTPNEAMWCCVGSGMENHGKYNEFIYTHSHDSLFVNLFVPSELNWKQKGVILKQVTQFPYEEQTRISVTSGSARFKVLIRYPSWVKAGELKITVNGKVVKHKNNPATYVVLDRAWKKGDEVHVTLPMHTRLEQMPHVPAYQAILHGPILLGAKTSTENLTDLVADDSRWGHIAGGKKLPVDKAPILITEDISQLPDKLTPVAGKPLTFTAPQLKLENPADLVFEPFFTIHDSRYMMYWMTLTPSQYHNYIDSIAQEERIRMEWQKRTVDFVAPGEQQPEADHTMQHQNSFSGNYLDQFWRAARSEGYFSYAFNTNHEKELSLVVRYWGNETGNRKFDIYIDDVKIATEDIIGKWNKQKFQDVVYSIPNTVVVGKNKVHVKFQALPGNTAGSVYYVRLIRDETN